MAVRIIWSHLALTDLKEIGAYIQRDNPEAARAFVAALVEKLDLLENFPLLGRVVPELANPAVRELILSPYRLVYRISAGQDTVEVSRVWHAARGKIQGP